MSRAQWWTKDYPIGGRFIQTNPGNIGIDYWEIIGYSNGGMKLKGTMLYTKGDGGIIYRFPQELRGWRFEHPKENLFTKLYLTLKSNA